LRRDLRHGRWVKYLINTADKVLTRERSRWKQKAAGEGLRRDLRDGRKYQNHVTKVPEEQSWQDKAKVQELPCEERRLVDTVLRRDLRHGRLVKYLKNRADKTRPWLENIKEKRPEW